MEAKDFIWGSNMELLKYLMILTVTDKKISHKKEYKDVITSGIDYLLGCNSMDVSYVTGNGEKAFKNPHLRPTAVDDIEVAAPCTATAAINVGSVMTTSAGTAFAADALPEKYDSRDYGYITPVKNQG